MNRACCSFTRVFFSPHMHYEVETRGDKHSRSRALLRHTTTAGTHKFSSSSSTSRIYPFFGIPFHGNNSNNNRRRLPSVSRFLCGCSCTYLLAACSSGLYERQATYKEREGGTEEVVCVVTGGLPVGRRWLPCAAWISCRDGIMVVVVLTSF